MKGVGKKCNFGGCCFFLVISQKSYGDVLCLFECEEMLWNFGLQKGKFQKKFSCEREINKRSVFK